MKKTLFLFLTLTIMTVSSSICLAGDGDGAQAYAENQARIVEINKPVVTDKEYPQWGFRTHSWITGAGSETIAHTQIIDITTGTVIAEMERHCNYTDPIYDNRSNK